MRCRLLQKRYDLDLLVINESQMSVRLHIPGQLKSALIFGLCYILSSFMQAVSADDVHLVFFLPAFDFAVLYSQPSFVQALDIRNTGAAQGALHIDEFRDPEVDYATGGHEPNPCEYKALKLSQALGSDGLDRCFKCLHMVPHKYHYSLL
jgi:hypothetical protein